MPLPTPEGPEMTRGRVSGGREEDVLAGGGLGLVGFCSFGVGEGCWTYWAPFYGEVVYSWEEE